MNPVDWTSVSEMFTDLSNELVIIDEWDSDLLYHPIQPQVPSSIYLDDDIPLAPGRPMAVDIPTTAMGRGDCFIDDIIKGFLDFPCNIKRHASSALLSVFLSMRPLAGAGGNLEPIP